MFRSDFRSVSTERGSVLKAGARTALYRHFDADGVLLYVGISNDALRRLCQHKDRAHWFATIARVELQWLDDRRAALAAEAHAIANEAPQWNVRRPVCSVAPSAVVYGNFAIEHLSSGWRDGNYFRPFEAAEMLAYWQDEFPDERFQLLRADMKAPKGATDGRPPLRADLLRQRIGGAERATP